VSNSFPAAAVVVVVCFVVVFSFVVLFYRPLRRVLSRDECHFYRPLYRVMSPSLEDCIMFLCLFQ
jgi:uncharacterized protein YggT (Ycf19 family)